MTQITFKTELDKNKMEALLHFLRSWGIEAEVKSSLSSQSEDNSDFPLTVGLWKDRDIDAKKLRMKAMGLIEQD
jgi:hypothetical protein